MSLLHDDDRRWYRRCATTTLDHLDEFGHAHLVNIEPHHLEHVRRCVLDEARRRRVKVRTYPTVVGEVVVIAVEPSVLAEAYTVITAAAIADRLEQLDDAGVITATRPWLVDCARPLV
jgi:hypothetical protein